MGQQQDRELAEREARRAEQSGDEYHKLLAEGMQYGSKQDWRKAGKACREAIALKPDEPLAYFNLGTALATSGHKMEAAQRYLEAKERFSVGSELWARVTAGAFDLLKLKDCDEVAKPEWWNDKELKALSARVVRAAPNDKVANLMRAVVLGGWCAERGSAAELVEAATHYERAAALSDAPAVKADYASFAAGCRSGAEAM